MGSSITLDGGLTQGQLREELSTFKSQIDERIKKEGEALAFAFNHRFDQIDKRLDTIDGRLDGIDKRLDVLESFQAAQQKLA